MISVLMGVYYQKDSLALLERSVDSILSQTLTDLEFVICDDGSKDSVRRYLEKKAENDHRVRLVRPGACLSLPEKLNVCLRESRGEWIARMDDDDYAYPDRLERQMQYLNEHSEISFVGCSARLCCGGEVVGERRFPEFPDVRDFYFSQPFLHPALLFKRQVLETVNGYSEDMRCRLCEDYDLLLRLYYAGYQGANMPDVLFDYTIPPTAKGNRRMKHRWNEVVIRFIRFRELGRLPQALPWVVKPIIVGALPENLLAYLKKRREGRKNV